MAAIESLPADTELLIVLDLQKGEMFACELAALLAKSAITTDTPESPGDVPLARERGKYVKLRGLITWPLALVVNPVIVLGNRWLDTDSNDIWAWPDDEPHMLDDSETSQPSASA